MTLSFPNQSRFYDARRRAVPFWGHDSAMEASFSSRLMCRRELKTDVPLDGLDFSARSIRTAKIDSCRCSRGFMSVVERGSYDLVAADFSP